MPPTTPHNRHTPKEMPGAPFKKTSTKITSNNEPGARCLISDLIQAEESIHGDIPHNFYNEVS